MSNDNDPADADVPSPHLLSERADADADHHAFWADEVADEIEARDPDEPIVIKGGVSPSGVPHVGHANELLRAYFVAEVLRERGHEVRQVFTSDDRDPLRTVPRRLADADWTLVGLGEVDAGALGRNLGKPYADIPDPFGDCHGSYAAHFADLLAETADLLGVDVETVSNDASYADGTFDGAVGTALRRADLARETLAPYQDKVDADYVPFNPICAECGKVTETVTAVDVDAGTVDYRCTDLEAGDGTIEGCGHEGTATLREGKLPWRFEWPAQWASLGVDFEPFGKDHAEGSWPSGVEIAEAVFGIEPPVPMVYEWFTLDGDALSSSEGNVVTVPELLDLLEPAVLRYFFALDPKRARDLDLSTLDQLVDDFDRFEAAYFGEVDDADLRAVAERAYPIVVGADDDTPDRPAGADPAGRVRLPYTFAAVLGMVEDRDLRVRLARDEGHFEPDTPEWAIEEALRRVEKARAWAERLDNEYNYRLQPDLPDVDFDPTVEAALDDIADVVAAGHSGEEIQGEMYETAREHDVEVSDFFAAGYRLFFDDDEGPKLGPFLAKLDQEFVLARLRRER